MIVLIGLIVVVTDGLTRPLVLEEDWVSSDAMTYQPNQAALVFALVMLPLMLAYRASTRISVREMILLWFVMCTIAYDKDFSYIHIPEIPLFVTDIVLGGLAVASCRSLGTGLTSLGSIVRLSMKWFALSGALCVARGFLSGQERLLVLRDSAIVVYSGFLLVGFLIISSWEAVRRLFLFFALGALFSSATAIAWFLMEPGQRRYISYGPYILSGMIGASVLTVGRWIRPTLGWPLAAALGLGALLANARTIDVALAFLLVIMVLVGPSGRLRISRRTIRLTTGLAAVSILVLLSFMQTKAGSTLVNTVVDELVSGTLHYMDDPNAGFRFLAWLEAGSRFAESPVLGEGFGTPFSFELTSYDVRPHNTFLTVLYKMGLVGFLPLATLLIAFHGLGWQALRTYHRRESLFLYVALLAQLSASLFGCLNLLLESPFLASVFWVIMGVGIRASDLLRQLNSDPAASQSQDVTNR